MSVPLTVCHECDALLQEAVPAQGEGSVVCPRCRAELYKSGPDPLPLLLALSSTALILLLLSNLFPVVGLNIQGHRVETTVFGAARQLWHDDIPFVAGLLFATTVLIPLIELLALTWMLLALYHGRRPAAFVLLFRSLQLAQPWAMVEVFLLGVLVSLVKLSHLADVLPGPALWCFAALMLVSAALSSVLDQRALWQAWEAAR